MAKILRNIRDSFKFYKKEANDLVTVKEFVDLNNEFNKFLISKVLNGEQVTLPGRFGNLAIVGKKQNVRFGENGEVLGLAPDWKKTKALRESNPEAKRNRQVVYCTNEHTSGYRYRYFWSKKRVVIENKTLYSLQLSRSNKREVMKRVLSGQEYVNL